MTKQKEPAYVVGIGASAGGLESLQKFFRQLPTDLGMSYVVVQHLSPDFESMMDELLAKHTDLPISKVSDGLELCADHVYLIPPGKEMVVEAGRLRLSDRNPNDKLTLPIDIFFRSLASGYGNKAVAIVLSGTGSDGSRGAVAVADAGGLVLAESEDSAKFFGMPRAAYETGCVDRVLSAREMGDALQRYSRISEQSQSLLAEDSPDQTDLERVLDLLKGHSGLNFSCYKSGTVARRINRRVLLHHHADLHQYLRQLEEDVEELDALYRDLLIGVTRFFRDEEAFDRMRRTVEDLVAKLPSGAELRIWSAGCATGEEAYSLVILANEAFRKAGRPPEIKAFATDVHEGALRIASQGRYPRKAVQQLPKDLQKRYFSSNGDTVQVGSEVRGQIVFARHDLLRDAPFTRLDLISCRNLLIYFTQEAQRKALTVCHFGLKRSGILFLGPSEATTSLGDEFTVLDPKWKIFGKRRDIRLLPTTENLPFSPSPPIRSERKKSQEVTDQAQSYILERFAPPSLLVSYDFKLMHTYAGASRYLRHQDGQVSLNVLDLVSGDLRVALSATLQRVKKNGEQAKFRGIKLPEQEQTLDIEVSPLFPDLESSSPFVVTIHPQVETPVADAAGETPSLNVSDAAAERIADLEQELAQTRENLQTTLEEMETSNEELQATNEELMASNEELQGTNQELHSVNEELYSVNAEYQNKIEELREVTADLNQLLENAQVHTLFLDRKLTIRRFTSGMGRMFDLLPQDEGRNLRTFTHHLAEPDLVGRLEQVIETGEKYEATVHGGDNQTFLMRLLPYARGDETDGVLLTLMDITDRHRAEQARTRLARVVDSSSDFVATADADGHIININRGGRRMLGLGDEDPLPPTLAECHPEWASEIIASSGLPTALRRGEWRGRLSLKGPEGQELPVSELIIAHRDAADEQVEYVSSVVRDLSELVSMVESLQEADQRKNDFIAMLGHELRNPLQGIQVSLDLLNAGGGVDVDRATRVIGHQIQRLSRLVDDLMDVSRITRGKIELQLEAIDLTALLEEGLNRAGEWVGRDHQFSANVPQDRIWIHGDAARIEQIIGNLLTNAAKYSDRGTRITLELDCDDETACISVRDEGVGLESDEIERIFEPFVQRDDANRSGLGLGLTLVRYLMDMHGGRVTASSDGRGKGSLFSVTFPRIAAPQDGVHPQRVRPTLAFSGQVLICDDNQEALQTLGKLLEQRGCTVYSAGCGKDAIELAVEYKPAVAVVDIGLPDMSGHQVAETIRARMDSGIRLIAMTGFGQQAVKRQALEAGFDQFLVKPVGLTDLEEALASVSGVETDEQPAA